MPNPKKVLRERGQGFETAPFEVDLGEDFPSLHPHYENDPWHLEENMVLGRRARLIRQVIAPPNSPPNSQRSAQRRKRD